MNELCYVVQLGPAGELGLFHSPPEQGYRRGDRVVVQRAVGLDIGVVVCAASARHQQMLTGAEGGTVLRLASAEDDAIRAGTAGRAEQIFEESRRLSAEMGVGIDILDVDVSLDGQRVELYFVRWGEGDERPLVAALSRRYESMVALRDLALPAGTSGCGKPGCGSGSGGCASCGTGGGCSTGCGSKAQAREVSDYFLGLRRRMEAQHRTPLL